MGGLDEALGIARKAADAAPDSMPANTQAGVILDLQGHYADARAYLEKALAAAATTHVFVAVACARLVG